MPSWEDGTLWLLIGFFAVNLLILMEVADRLSLKGELEMRAISSWRCCPAA